MPIGRATPVSRLQIAISDADGEILRGDEYGDREHHHLAIHEGGRRVEEQPDPLAIGVATKLLQSVRAKHVSIDQIAPVPGGTLRQVRDFQQIGKNIVAVITQERIAVEHHRRNAGDHHGVEGQRPNEPRLDREPYVERQRGEEHLDDHAGRADKRAPPFAAESRCGGGVDIGQRRKHQDHHPELVHRSSERLDRKSMPKFMQSLEHEIDQREWQKVVGGKDAVGSVGAELLPVLCRQHQRRQHHEQPQNGTRPAEQPFGERPCTLEKPVRMPERNPQCQRVEHVAEPPGSSGSRGALYQRA